ncbi:MAG: hypothetical protein E7547_05795 [Ruminococcaceae bacterium]|nr:hypothetical protein [Oscillospiraceae bacterium]
MSTQKIFQINPGADLSAIVDFAAKSLSGQGYEVQVQVMSSTSATMVVKKDREGFKNIIGLGLECRVIFSVLNGSQLTVNIDSEWMNKVLAIVIGWFFCMIPFITGIVGGVGQFGLPEKISSAVVMSISQSDNPMV